MDNKEGNRDGTDDNRSWNCGVEGETEDPEISALRATASSATSSSTLMVSQGTPMLLGGDERSRSQGGNNNPWCQDNEISWIDWELTEAAQDLHDFTQRAIKMRLSHPVFRRESFLAGSNVNDDVNADPADADLADGWWFRPDGEKMSPAEWDGPERAFGLFLNGEAIPDLGPQGQRISDDSFLLLFNACAVNVDFTFPRRYADMRWAVELSTMAPGALPGSSIYDATDLPCDAHPPVHAHPQAGRVSDAEPTVTPGPGVVPPRALRATYRLQLTPEFDFDFARELIPYLAELGVSHLYLSPTLQAQAGSTHGYDVADPSKLSAELGGEEAFRALAAAAHAADMGIILDVVPNHMAASDENRFWADEELRERFFDIDPVSGRWRRFFDVDDLAAIRVESDEVFEATHTKILSLVSEGLVDGLRVDHPDGLADPEGYLRRLADAGVSRVWVEKILGTEERLPESWPVSGTVGYDFLNDLVGLSVNPDAEELFTALWAEVSGDDRPFGAWALDAKLEQARGTFTPEVERLSRIEGAPGVDALAYALSTQAAVSQLHARVGRGVHHPLSADLPRGDGQGRRGHDLLPLLPAARAQRGRRRPGPVLAVGRRLPRP